MTDEKERDEAIENAINILYAQTPTLSADDFPALARLVWNASRKHRDLQIADELDGLLIYSDHRLPERLMDYVKQLREGTK